MAKTDNKKAPRCPYCGAEMRLENNEDVLFGLFADEERMYWYQCNAPLCGIHSPARHTEADAYKAAIARWQEPNRVLTLEEVIADANADSWKFEWVERKGEKDIIHQTCPFSVNTERTIFASPGDKRIYRGDNSNYGVTWRSWLRKPTEDEREAAKWLPEKKKDGDDDE